MDDTPTCGKGLADHSPLPTKLGELTDAVAEVLEAHMKALDVTDESSRKELAAYGDLARSHRKIAADLKATAKQMAGYRDLPMGRHDEQVMMGTEARDAFRRFVTREQELLALLQSRMQQDRQMLDAMRGAGVSPA